ncbi:unnamed protein product [Closterium sp. NIES-54]
MDSFTAGPVSSREGRSQCVSQHPAYLRNSYLLPGTVRRQVTKKPHRSLPKNANAQQARAPPSPPPVTPSFGGGDSCMLHGSTSHSSSSTAQSSWQDEEGAAEGESSRRRRKRNINGVLQGSARQEGESEAPPAASLDDDPNEALPRLNPVQSNDEDAAEAEDEEEAGADEEDAGAESWLDETPLTREEMTSLRELQEATTRAIARLESVFLAKPAGDGEPKRKRRRKRASGNGKRHKARRTRSTSETTSEDEEEADEGLEGHIRSSSLAILQKALILLPVDKGWKFPSLWNSHMRAFVRCCAQVSDAIRNWEARKGRLSNSAGCNAHIVDGLHVLVKCAVIQAIAEFRPEYDAASQTWAWGRHGLRISADSIAGGRTASAQASTSLGTPWA